VKTPLMAEPLDDGTLSVLRIILEFVGTGNWGSTVRLELLDPGSWLDKWPDPQGASVEFENGALAVQV
jgi:hypothetical protein